MKTLRQQNHHILIYLMMPAGARTGFHPSAAEDGSSLFLILRISGQRILYNLLDIMIKYRATGKGSLAA
jgi:hypothetical protein